MHWIGPDQQRLFPVTFAAQQQLAAPWAMVTDELRNIAKETVRLLKCPGQFIQPAERGMILRQQRLERLVH